MAMTTSDCLRIHHAMKEADVKLMIDFSIRFSGAARLIKEQIGSPLVSHGQCKMNKADLSRWRWHPEEGGGPLYDVGVHAVDLLCWIHNSDPVEVYATGGQITHPGELGTKDMIDTVATTIRFANGSVATFLMSDAGSSSVVSKWFFEFFDMQKRLSDGRVPPLQRVSDAQTSDSQAHLHLLDMPSMFEVVEVNVCLYLFIE